MDRVCGQASFLSIMFYKQDSRMDIYDAVIFLISCSVVGLRFERHSDWSRFVTWPVSSIGFAVFISSPSIKNKVFGAVQLLQFRS